MGGNGQSNLRRNLDLANTHSERLVYEEEGQAWEALEVKFRSWHPRLINLLDFNLLINSEGKIYGRENMTLGELSLSRDYSGELEGNSFHFRCVYGDGTVGVFSGSFLQIDATSHRERGTVPFRSLADSLQARR
jgi:hypothetical protein